MEVYEEPVPRIEKTPHCLAVQYKISHFVVLVKTKYKGVNMSMRSPISTSVVWSEVFIDFNKFIYFEISGLKLFTE